MTTIAQLFLAVVLATALGCVSPQALRDATRVGVLDPKPMVDLPMKEVGLELAIAPEVPDNFEYTEPGWRAGVPVEKWHTSLENGFAAGPGRFFASSVAPDERYRLAISHAELTWVTSAFFARGARVVGAASMHAKLKFAARLEAPNGDVISRCQGEVFSTNPWVDRGGTTITAKEALTAMYERIAVELVAPWADRL